MVNHSILAQLLKHRHFAQVSSAADSALLSPNLRPPAKQMINLHQFTKAVETPGSFQTIWYTHVQDTILNYVGAFEQNPAIVASTVKTTS